jgi:putative PIN family toxin of toxin-antitoxin system
MIRVVIDTNILVSALLSRNGAPAQALRMILEDPEMQVCVSGEVYAEYDEVLRRPKLKRSRAEIDGLLSMVRKTALWVKQTESVRECADPDDDIFLECAQAARSHYLITGNTRHFPERWDVTRIVTVREFLDSVS